MFLNNKFLNFSFFTLFSFILKEVHSSSTEAEIVKTILNSNYNPAVIPQNRTNTNAPLNIRLGVAFISLLEINEKQGYMNSDVWLRMKWVDTRLQYKSERPGGVNITVLRISSNNVWIPPIRLINGYGDEPRTPTDKVLVYPNGEVLWVPKLNIQSICSIDMSYFPFDESTCSLKFQDVVHDLDEIDLKLYDNLATADMSDYWKSATWIFVKTHALRNVRKNPVEFDGEVDLTFYLTFRRRSSIYCVSILLPVILISFVSILNFALPTDSKQKLVLGLTSFASLFVVLNHLGTLIPNTEFNTMPYIMKYVIFVLVLNILSTLGTILILILSSKESNMNKWIQKFILRKDIFEGKTKTGKPNENNLIANDENQVSSAENAIIKTLNERKIQNEKNDEWKKVAKILDLTFLSIFTIITLCGTIIYLVSAGNQEALNEIAAKIESEN